MGGVDVNERCSFRLGLLNLGRGRGSSVDCSLVVVPENIGIVGFAYASKGC